MCAGGVAGRSGFERLLAENPVRIVRSPYVSFLGAAHPDVHKHGGHERAYLGEVLRAGRISLQENAFTRKRLKAAGKLIHKLPVVLEGANLPEVYDLGRGAVCRSYIWAISSSRLFKKAMLSFS